MKTEGGLEGYQPNSPVRIRVIRGEANGSEFSFDQTFQIGRDPKCQIQLKNTSVSRQHAEIRVERDGWWVRDLGSSNGTFLDGVRIREARLPDTARLEVGKGGSLLSLTLQNREINQTEGDPSQMKGRQESVTQTINRYFAQKPSNRMGEHTMMIRRAFERVNRKQSRRYGAIIGVIVSLLFLTGGVVVYQEMKLKKMMEMAENLFYTMKSVELQVSAVEDVVHAGGDADQRREMAEKRSQIEKLKKQYDSFVQEIGVYGKDMTHEEKIIYRIARIFGECELTMPVEFVNEVWTYIEKWQSSDRLSRAMARAEERGYASQIGQVLVEHNLPPQLFYLALQESNFNARSVGPKTRFGIAKGMWQFIPMTALEYGLQTGPLIEIRRFDRQDERFHFEKATSAAARYLRDIYSTEAQASGLLVIASYNWGHNKVRRLIQQMPENPRERNFWKLLEHYQIPSETYDYVFYIFSAAVIGEDPKLFGFDFGKPHLGSGL